MPRKKTTMEDLARELGVSRLTVSKALRGLPGMSLETRRDILRLAEAKGYLTREQKESALFEHTSLQSLQPRRFYMVLQEHNASPSHVHLELLKGLNQRFHGTHSSVAPLFAPAAASQSDAAWREWSDGCGLAFADGIFIPPMTPPELEKRLLDLPLPRILLNFPPTGAMADSVVWDVYESVRQAVQLLAEHGHRRILYIGDTRSSRGYRLRWSAFAEAMAEHGLEADPARHLTVPQEADRIAWREEFIRLMTAEKPTALLNTVEGYLPWIYYLCSQSGLSIPADCSLVSLDVSAEPPAPGLCYFYLPVRETGARAADRMIWRIANPGEPLEHLRLQGRLVRGDSLREAPRE